MLSMQYTPFGYIIINIRVRNKIQEYQRKINRFRLLYKIDWKKNHYCASCNDSFKMTY